jgi:hypothetical protein
MCQLHDPVLFFITIVVWGVVAEWINKKLNALLQQSDKITYVVASNKANVEAENWSSDKREIIILNSLYLTIKRPISSWQAAHYLIVFYYFVSFIIFATICYILYVGC